MRERFEICLGKKKSRQYYKLNLFNADVLIMSVRIFMYVNKLCLNQQPQETKQTNKQKHNNHNNNNNNNKIPTTTTTTTTTNKQTKTTTTTTTTCIDKMCNALRSP